MDYYRMSQSEREIYDFGHTEGYHAGKEDGSPIVSGFWRNARGDMTDAGVFTFIALIVAMTTVFVLSCVVLVYEGENWENRRQTPMNAKVEANKMVTLAQGQADAAAVLQPVLTPEYMMYLQIQAELGSNRTIVLGSDFPAIGTFDIGN